MNLEVGQRVKLYRRAPRGKYKPGQWFLVEQVLDRMIVLRKEFTGYKETINILDLRLKFYRLLGEDGKEIKFPKVPDLKDIEKQKKGEVKMSKPTKLFRDEIEKLYNSGKSIDEIASIVEVPARTVKGTMVRWGLIPKENNENNRKNDNKKQKVTKSDRNEIKFYIASAYNNKDQVRKVAGILKAMGWKQVFDWTDSEDAETYESAKAIALAEINAAVQCDVMIVLLPDFYGTHTELGAAIAAGKNVYLWAPSDDFFKYNPQSDDYIPFYFHPRVHRLTGDILDFIRVMINKSKGVGA